MADNPETEVTETLAHLTRMANRLDARYRLPILGVRFGWDSILGLVPGVGDAVTVVPAAYTVYHAHRLGARKRVLARMGVNTAADLLVGSIPLVGDIFDIYFKANRRNLRLLTQELDRPGSQPITAFGGKAHA